jgi:hypothetical protein
MVQNSCQQLVGAGLIKICVDNQKISVKPARTMSFDSGRQSLISGD